MIRLETEDYWMCEQRERWEDNEEVARNIMKDLKMPSGEEWEYGDRRQELVFIGQVILSSHWSILIILSSHWPGPQTRVHPD